MPPLFIFGVIVATAFFFGGLSTILDFIISVIIGSTIVHEFIGPIMTKIALRKAGELAI